MCELLYKLPHDSGNIEPVTTVTRRCLYIHEADSFEAYEVAVLVKDAHKSGIDEEFTHDRVEYKSFIGPCKSPSSKISGIPKFIVTAKKRY